MFAYVLNISRLKLFLVIRKNTVMQFCTHKSDSTYLALVLVYLNSYVTFLLSFFSNIYCRTLYVTFYYISCIASIPLFRQWSITLVIMLLYLYALCSCSKLQVPIMQTVSFLCKNIIPNNQSATCCVCEF